MKRMPAHFSAFQVEMIFAVGIDLGLVPLAVQQAEWLISVCAKQLDGLRE